MDMDFINLVANAIKCNPEVLKEDSTAETVHEWDSLNHWRVISLLEDSYDVEFTMDEATEFKNLGHIYEILIKKLHHRKIQPEMV